MARPGDLRKHCKGWVEIIAHVDDKGQPTGGYLVPPGNDDMVEDVVAYIKEEEEKNKLRDIATRLGASLGMDPEEVFERFIFALQADTLLAQRKLVEAMKKNWWDEAMLPVFKAVLDALPPEEEEGVEEDQIIFCPGCGEAKKVRRGVFTGFVCDCRWKVDVAIGMWKGTDEPEAQIQAWKPLDESKG